MALPLRAFGALAAIFWFRLGSGDPSRIPSALIGRAAPQTALPPLAGLINNGAQLDPAVFKGKVSIVNVWASWCVPCHEEATLLSELARDKRLQIVGIKRTRQADNLTWVNVGQSHGSYADISSHDRRPKQTRTLT
jgi:cytochrome c biogenesis protein CcmG/thiol:disulfide interchange protein DsbE